MLCTFWVGFTALGKKKLLAVRSLLAQMCVLADLLIYHFCACLSLCSSSSASADCNQCCFFSLSLHNYTLNGLLFTSLLPLLVLLSLFLLLLLFLSFLLIQFHLVIVVAEVGIYRGSDIVEDVDGLPCDRADSGGYLSDVCRLGAVQLYMLMLFTYLPAPLLML